MYGHQMLLPTSGGICRVLAAMCAGVCVASAAQDAPPPPGAPSAQDLAKLKQNPVSGLRQLIVTANVNPDVPGAEDSLDIYSLQAVWPFALGPDWRVITYTILPAVHLPATASTPAVSGLGNTLLNFYLSPRASEGGFVWGLGPAVLLPTRAEPALGSDRVGLGPSGILFYAQDPWSVGVVLQNVWSLGGAGVNEVNEFGAQYIFNYNLDRGWYIYSNQTITADWTAPSGERWTVPIAAGVGKIFNLGQQPMSATLQVYSNVVRPEGAARWGLNFQLSMLFP